VRDKAVIDRAEIFGCNAAVVDEMIDDDMFNSVSFGNRSKAILSVCGSFEA
jgi:hypothetical protein